MQEQGTPRPQKARPRQRVAYSAARVSLATYCACRRDLPSRGRPTDLAAVVAISQTTNKCANGGESPIVMCRARGVFEEQEVEAEQPEEEVWPLLAVADLSLRSRRLRALAQGVRGNARHIRDLRTQSFVESASFFLELFGVS